MDSTAFTTAFATFSISFGVSCPPWECTLLFVADLVLCSCGGPGTGSPSNPLLGNGITLCVHACVNTLPWNFHRIENGLNQLAQNKLRLVLHESICKIRIIFIPPP